MDEAIVRSAQGGDPTALTTLVDDLLPTVLAVAYGFSGDRDDAADIAQEALAVLVDRIGEVREPAALPGWLVAVVRSAARRHRRLRSDGPDRARRERTTPDDPGPDDVAVARDEARRLRAAVEELHEDLRLPIVLHYFAGVPLAGIVDLTGLPMSTVKQRMRSGRARVRERLDAMDQPTGRPAAGAPGRTVRAAELRSLGPDVAPTDVVRLFVAMRSGDVARVASILDARPDLVDAREGWTRAESAAHRLPRTRGGGTLLLRAVERGDRAMVRLLLARGADPDGRCTCEGGERPVWVAAVQREVGIVDDLLMAGADPDAVAFAGSSAVEVARRRGYRDVVDRLERAGASQAAGEPPPLESRSGAGAGAPPLLAPGPGAGSGRRPRFGSPSGAGAAEPLAPGPGTAIATIDLWCPFPERGLVHLAPGYGLGAVVLIAERARAAPTDELDAWLAQPFFVAEPVTGRPGTVVRRAELCREVAARLAPGAG